jgi:Protein of unknown function (DUF4238)
LNENDGDRQHYVPQFLLRNFAAGTKKKKRAQVHVFDKHSGTRSLERIKEVAAQPGFYDLPAPSSGSGDPALTDLENRVAPVLAGIVNANSLGHLTTDNQVLIAAFCAAQMVRVPMWREQLRTLNQLVRDAVGEMDADADAMGLSELTAEDARAQGVLWLRHVPEFMPHFLRQGMDASAGTRA